MEGLERITQTPGVMSAKACIRGHRVTVGAIVGDIGAGQTIEQVLEAFLIWNEKMCCRRCGIRHDDRPDESSSTECRSDSGHSAEPAEIGTQVLAALSDLAAELQHGALVTIDPKRTRARLLPLRRSSEE